MSALHDRVRTWPDGDEQVLFDERSGRSVRLGADTLDHLDDPRYAAVVHRLDRLAMLSTSRAPSFPLRKRNVLLLPDRPALWVPVPDHHTAGGHAYRAEPITAQQVELWRGLDGNTEAAVPARWTSAEVQAVEVRDRPPARPDPTLWRTVGLPRDSHARTHDQRGTHGQTTLAEYHLDHITDGATHFDDRETTVAHAHGVPHPGLGDRRFGEALFDALSAMGAVPQAGRILEVGGGTGELAQAFWQCARSSSSRYLRADLSPELLRTQASRLPDSPGFIADGTRLPLPDASIDLVLNNEVIADMSAGPRDTPGVDERLQRYGLHPLPPGSLYNIGAWRFVEEVARVLAPGGHAYLSEFGSPEGAPEEAVQLDHPEVSIHFGDLARIAVANGLEAQVRPMADFLGFDLSATQVARPIWMAARALARSHGMHLPARAWRSEALAAALPERCEGLWEWPLAREGPGPLVTRFYVLWLRKPGPSPTR